MEEVKVLLLAFYPQARQKNLQVLLDGKVELDTCKFRVLTTCWGLWKCRQDPQPPEAQPLAQGRGRGPGRRVRPHSGAFLSLATAVLPSAPDTGEPRLRQRAGAGSWGFAGETGQQPERRERLWSNKIQRLQLNTNPPLHYINI